MRPTYIHGAPSKSSSRLYVHMGYAPWYYNHHSANLVVFSNMIVISHPGRKEMGGHYVSPIWMYTIIFTDMPASSMENEHGYATETFLYSFLSYIFWITEKSCVCFFTGTAPGSLLLLLLFFSVFPVSINQKWSGRFFRSATVRAFFLFLSSVLYYFFLGGWGSECV